jgi:hypothetical protein
MRHSVFKDWVFALPYRMQSVLVLSLRGCDTARKDDHSKFVQRGLRGLVFNNADPSNDFIVDGIPDEERVKAFLWDIDCYPMHYVMHTAHAAEIVGYKHPDEDIATWWLGFYKKVCKALHLNFEREKQLDVRLGYTNAEKEMLRTSLPPSDDPDLLAAFEAALIADEPEFAQHLAKHGWGKTTPKKEKWDAGTGTSHGSRGRVYSGAS